MNTQEQQDDCHSVPSFTLTKHNKTQRKLLARLINLPPKEYVRPHDALPFHIPHKKVFQQAAAAKRPLEEDYEPIPGLLDAQYRKSLKKKDEHVKIIKPPKRMSIDERPSSEQISSRICNIPKLIELLRTDKNVGFYYLVEALPKHSVDYHPYCLRIATFDEVNENKMMTISRNGVMHKTKTDSEFIPLNEWERDYKNYCKLTKLKSFKQFYLYKAYKNWNIKVRCLKFYQAREELEEVLIHYHPDLLEAALSVRNVCCSLNSLSFMDDSTIEKLQLSDFQKNQEFQIQELKDKLSSTRSLLRDIVNHACLGELLTLGFTPDDRNLRVPSELIGTVAMFGVETTEDGRYRMSFEDMWTKKRTCMRLSKFITLIDYIVINFLHTLVLNSLSSVDAVLRKHLEFLPPEDKLKEMNLGDTLEPPRPGKPKFPLFLVELMPSENDLVLKPEYREWIDAIAGMMASWESVVSGIQPFVTDSYFKKFTQPSIGGEVQDRLCSYSPSITFVLNDDRDLKRQKETVMKLMRHNLDAVMIYSQRFQDIRARYIANVNIDPDTIMDETALDKLRAMLVHYTEEKGLNESIIKEQALGLFLLNMNYLKSNAIPKTEHILRLLSATLPKIGHDKVEELLNECADAQKYIETEPLTSLNYVEYMEFLEKCPDRGNEIDNWLEYLKELYDMAEEYFIPVSPEDENAFYILGDRLTLLHNTVESLLNESDKIIAKFNEKISKDTKALMDEIVAIRKRSVEPWLVDINSNQSEVLETLGELGEKLQVCQKLAVTYKGYQRQMKVEVDRFEALDEVINEIKLRQLLWENLTQWDEIREHWLKVPFSQLNPEEMQQTIGKFLKNIVQFEKGLPRNEIVPLLKDKVENMRDKMTVIVTLINPNLKPRHWNKIELILNYKFKPEEVLTLKLLEEIGIYYKGQELTELSGQASSEAGLETLLKKIEDTWKSLEFVVLPHKDSNDVFILAGLEEVQAALDETNINLATIASSRHVGPIKQRVDDWSKQIDLFSRTLDEWLNCQTNWLYLEPIFSAPDIQRQLPTEAKLFLQVDKSWKEIMRRAAKNPLAIAIGAAPGILEAFTNNNRLLDQILKCLEAYLESKRVIFPRFYFLSNEELLEILAQTRNPHAVQPHLRKCFDAIAKLEFGMKPAQKEEGKEADEEEGSAEPEMVMTTDIIAMISPEGERVPLGKGLKARGNVEDWLGKVEESMFDTLWRLMKYSIEDFALNPRKEWVMRHPAQIIITVSQIMWARDVHAVLSTDRANVDQALAGFEKKCFNNLNALAGMVRGSLPQEKREILITLITIDVHARDIISGMVESRVRSGNNFEWVKQLRYYWEKEIDNCTACMASARHVYGFEYLGVSTRLVITPLTDKCYLCLMGALQLDLGGAPAGPAGTGKTESTKDLAKSLAIQCVVFNCSEGLDYKMMGRFFSGLAQSGAWCCFDEFNRIDIEVLSVIAQQLITIRNAKAAKLTRFMFEGREIKLVRQCAAFITMNPGYAGRTELPDNLKSVFRPMAMMVPDYKLIAEVTLYSEGFESSKVLAQKMVNMYKLCSEQLSQQDHYDFGMRAVKSVLVMAGSLKRGSPDKSEDVVLIRALRDSNLPKFLAEDAILFQGIINDLFPGVTLPEHDYGVFQDNIAAIITSMGLQPEKCTFVKVIQLYETLVVRHGVMTVGPTGGGKTTVLNILKFTLTKLHSEGVKGPFFRPVTTYTLNPKSVTMGELYGEVNLTTMEWRDGLLGLFVRTSVQCTEERHQWVVCDGPVDAVWIENMNTVLDDNKMLCLANSERIKLTKWVHMLFEVQDLAQASPATVSRCGMVYIDPGELKWLPYVKTWLGRLLTKETISDTSYEYLVGLFETYVEAGFVFIRKNCDFAIHQVDISKIAMMCSIMNSILVFPDMISKYADWGTVKSILCQTFIFGYIWSLGGNLIDASREAFEGFVRGQFDEVGEARLPTGVDLWDMFFSTSTKRLMKWATIVPAFKYNPSIEFFDVLVPTIDTVRFGYMMELLLDQNHPVLYTGPTGIGKSVIARTVLNSVYETGKWVPVTLNFSAQTSSTRTQDMIEGKLEKKKKSILGAPEGKRVVVFVDDVNMPKLETYGAQPPIELLRQYLDFKGFYDREKLFWKEIRDVVLCAACAPPGGGRNPLTPRFVRHFGLLLIPSPTTSSLQVIFRSLMRGFLADFAKSIAEIADSLVAAAIELYQRITEDLLPTPAKSHYVFNLRDLSKCVQGILQADAGTMRDTNDMERLFYHECLRVFHDRLIDQFDKSYFYHLLQSVCQRAFGSPVIKLPSQDLITEPPVLLFGDFMSQAAKEDRIYEEIKNIEKLRGCLQDYLMDYNLTTGKEMRLIFFMDAIEHVCRLARMLRAQRGNGLLVGVGGMGKQSLTKLSAHLNQCKCFQIELSRNYDYNSFHEDLRKLYFNAGALNEDTVFLFTDNQIVQEEFLEDINNILNSGEVPNLFESDEYEKVIIACRPPAKEAGINETNRDAIFDFFISRVRSRLHLVICMSPIGDAFRRRCRMFPSLVNCCTIDWFTEWPEEALLSVARTSLENLVSSNLVEEMSRVCYTIHSSVEKMTVRYYNEMRRYYYVTPSSYLDLLKQYESMLKNKISQITTTRNRISNGLKKLAETNKLVAEMKIQLISMEPQLKTKSAATAALMVSLVKEKSQADEVRQIVMADEAVVKVKADETQALADDAQKDLDMALPAMEAATKALEALNKNDINELRVFLKPPNLVKFVMEAVCLLLGVKQDWASAKVVLGEGNFLKRLQDYDKDNIPESTLKKLKTYISHPEFLPEIVATQSKVCKSMCMWVRAIDTYAKVYRIVEPKRKKKEQAEKELNSIMTVLRAKQQRLADVEAQIAKLEQTYDNSLAEKAKLEDTMALCSARLNRSGRLTAALADEQLRWEQSVKTLAAELVNVPGDVLIAAACVAYLGAFTSNYREELSQTWLQEVTDLRIPASETFSLIAVLADPYEIRVWNTCGLPRDSVSTENGIYVTKASRWPLMIDPQEQANRWIRQMEAENNLKMIKMTDAGFMRVLESAIRTGLPVLIWEVGETLDPTLRPILLKQVTEQAGRHLIRLGDSDVDYDPAFRLYMTTKMSNPHYLPEICIQVTLVNFTVTPTGLEDQLLADVVRLERPDLEKQRTELIVRINKDKGQLKAIEDKILKLLFSSTGNILDDEELVETLNESKETSAVIVSRLSEAEETEEQITLAREGYRSVATRGSCLYFVVSKLADIDPMYQFSLKYFTMVFNTVIEVTPKCPELSVRLQTLIDEITVAVYNNVSRGLFERHKLVYSFLLCASIFLQSGQIREDEWNFLLRGPVGTVQGMTKKPDIPALSEMNWLCCNFLADSYSKYFAKLPSCVGTKITVNVGDYELKITLAGDKSPESPVDWNESLSLFRRMMLIKAIKEEKLVFAITEYVKVELGKEFIESPMINLHTVYNDTSNVIPLIFVLSTGCDPVGGFLRFAAETGNTDRINSISLGQGQGPIAAKMIEKGVAKGDWVFLQNCHLASSWMLSMEKIIMNISDNPGDVNPDFRLYMSSMPSKTFPVSVLQNAVKVTNEPPKGLRANLKRAFAEIQDDYFADHPLEGRWRKMIFGLCFFHAVILERKKFGPLGWNILYEFNDSDRECALLNLNLFCEKGNSVVPWDALTYITGEITYGGRVTDYWDQRTLKTILYGFFGAHTLARGYKYSESGTYYCPESSECSTLENYRNFIEGLPLIEEPEIFGMHENANIAFQTKETASIIVTILDIQPKESGGVEGKSSDDIVFDMAVDMQERIIKKINPDDAFPAHMKRDDKGRLTSLTTVLMQEIERFNKMLRVIHMSLENLKKAIKGFIVMSDALEEVYKAFMNNQVPKMWNSVAYPSLKSLGSWTRDLELRLDFILVWLTLGSPISYWLSGFFFPQGFMTGVLQTHARKYDLPIDQLKIDFQMLSTTLTQEEIMLYHQTYNRDNSETYKNLTVPEDGVIIHGLFLDAARFDTQRGVLADANPGEMNPELPAMILVPATSNPSLVNRYEAPLYKTSVRAGVLSTTGHSTNFVIIVFLPTDKPQRYWILKGTALLTQVTD